MKGWSGDNCETGTACDKAMDGNDCQNGGTPIGATGSCECSCPGGYTGANCETAGVCTTAADGTACNKDGGVAAGDLTQTDGACTCTCNEGYTGLNCEHHADFCAANSFVKDKKCQTCAKDQLSNLPVTPAMENTFCGNLTCPYLTKSSGATDQVTCADGKNYAFTTPDSPDSYNICYNKNSTIEYCPDNFPFLCVNDKTDKDGKKTSLVTCAATPNDCVANFGGLKNCDKDWDTSGSLPAVNTDTGGGGTST